jgi:hypothetical protein
MPKKLDRCVSAVIKSGKSESSAFAICNAQMNAAKMANKKPKK